MQFVKTWFLRLTEGIAALLLAAIFLTFLAQIFARYVSELAWLMPIPFVAAWMESVDPLGWTVNLISLLWVWAVFFGCSFLVREHHHVTFDILYLSLPQRWKKLLTFVSVGAVLAILIWSFPATWDAIMANRLKELKTIQTLRIPITGDKIAVKWLFFTYILFLVVLFVRYSWHLVHVAMRGLPPEDQDPGEQGPPKRAETP